MSESQRKQLDTRTRRVIHFRKGDTLQICGAEIQITNGTGKLTALVKAPAEVRYDYRSRLTILPKP